MIRFSQVNVNLAVKGLIAAILSAIGIHLAGNNLSMGSLIGFIFFLSGHLNGHKFGREEMAKEIKVKQFNSQPETKGDDVA